MNKQQEAEIIRMIEKAEANLTLMEKLGIKWRAFKNRGMWFFYKRKG